MKKILTLIAIATVVMVIYPDTAVAFNDEGYVNVSGLHLRSSPNSTRDGVTHTDNVITTLAHGDRVRILADIHGWLRVQSRGQEGYVWNTFITISSIPLSAPTVTPTPPTVQPPATFTNPTPSQPIVQQPVQTHEPVYTTSFTVENEASIYLIDGYLSPDIEAAIIEFLENLPPRVYIDIGYHFTLTLNLSFSLVDIDGNGVPEIILHYGGSHRGVYSEVYKLIDSEFRRVYLLESADFPYSRLVEPVFFTDSHGMVIVYTRPFVSYYDYNKGFNEGEGFYRITMENSLISLEPIVTLLSVQDTWSYLIKNHLAGETILSTRRMAEDIESNWVPLGLRQWIDEGFVLYVPSYIPTIPSEFITRITTFDGLSDVIRQRLSANQE